MMSLNPKTQQTTERLQLALSDGHFQSDLRSAGQKLLAHLRRPTQITVMGPKTAGKSSLIKMILGAHDIVLPQGVAISELVFGTNPRVTYEGAASGTRHQPHGLAQQDIPEGTVRVVQELPLEQLKGKSLVEINLPTRPEQQKIILDWAIETTDILIWCTQSFDTREAAVWQKIPERLKDHSLLALTKADRLQLQDTLKAQSARFEQELADEFLGMFPVATKQAIAARDGETVTQPGLWTNSGAEALMHGLTRQINSGKMADLDQADMLLARATNAQGRSNPNDTKPRPSRSKTAKSEPCAKSKTLPKSNLITEAVTRLDDYACKISGTSDDAHLDAQEVLKQTLCAVQDLTSTLSQTKDASLSQLKDEASECEQLVLLLQLEKTDTAANDALTALLQLKKELVQELDL